jgi:death-on-curing protein
MVRPGGLFLWRLIERLKSTAVRLYSATASFSASSPTSDIAYLTVESLTVLGSDLTEYLREQGDPLPRYDVRDEGKIDSILATPQKFFGGQELYLSIYEKAACYLYFFVKFHPYLDGNKRMAVLATFVFLEMNRYRVDVEYERMYDFCKHVAASHRTQEVEFGEVVQFLRDHTHPL